MDLTKKYLNTYITQFFSILLNLVSVLIVMPRLSAFHEHLGIYALANSLLSYMAYGDFGFLGAGIKYATESHARQDTRELDFVGFVTAVLFLALGLFLVCTVGFVIFYNVVKLKNVSSELAQFFNYVMMVLIIFSPVYVLRRIVQVFYSIRFEDYYLRIFFGLGSILKIISSFILVKQDPAGVGHYFLFGNIVDLFIVILCFFFAFKRYDISFVVFFKKVKISKKIYEEVKHLAFASLFSTFSWMIFFELDSLFLATFGNFSQIGLMAACLMLVGYLRTIMGIFFSPFSVRFNYFTGLRDYKGLSEVCVELVNFSFPFSLFFVFSIALLTKPLLLSWLGPTYLLAVTCTVLYILSFAFSFAQYPGGMMLVSLERNKEMVISSFIVAVVYWLGVAIFFKSLGIVAIGLFKLICFVLMFIFYMYKIIVFTKISFKDFLIRKIGLGSGILVILYFLDFFVERVLFKNVYKSYWMVGEIILVGASYFFIAVLLYYLVSSDFRKTFKKIVGLLNLSYFSKKNKSLLRN